jgi:hypothetical protein
MRCLSRIILLLVAFVPSCNRSQSYDDHPHFIKLRETSEPVSQQQWRQLTKSNEIFDLSSDTGSRVLTSSSRIYPSVQRQQSGVSIATFDFKDQVRRCETWSGAASVFTDGLDYAIVDEDQCGTPVRFAKYNRDDELVFETIEHCHAHSRACFSNQTKLVFIYVYDASEIWVHDWENGKKIGSLPVLPNEESSITIAIDKLQQYLYVSFEKDRTLTIRKYPIADLRKTFALNE